MHVRANISNFARMSPQILIQKCRSIVSRGASLSLFKCKKRLDEFLSSFIYLIHWPEKHLGEKMITRQRLVHTKWFQRQAPWNFNSDQMLKKISGHLRAKNALCALAILANFQFAKMWPWGSKNRSKFVLSTGGDTACWSWISCAAQFSHHIAI